jgi:hypothetical protein
MVLLDLASLDLLDPLLLVLLDPKDLQVLASPVLQDPLLLEQQDQRVLQVLASQVLLDLLEHLLLDLLVLLEQQVWLILDHHILGHPYRILVVV